MFIYVAGYDPFSEENLYHSSTDDPNTLLEIRKIVRNVINPSDKSGNKHPQTRDDSEISTLMKNLLKKVEDDNFVISFCKELNVLISLIFRFNFFKIKREHDPDNIPEYLKKFYGT
jgi:hypothetical protein